MTIIRYWLPALFLLLVSIAAPAQKAEFDRAKKAGREPGKYYVADLSKKDYTKDDVLAFAKKNGYACQNIKEDVITIYGAHKRVAVSVEFLPADEDLGNPKTMASATASASSSKVASPNSKKILSILEKAVSKGLDPECHCFRATFPEASSYYTASAVMEVMAANGYYIKSLKSPNREQISEVQFVPHSRFPEAVYATYYPKSVDFSKLKNASVWFPDKDLKFSEIGDVYWSGAVSQGKISGEGYGFQFVSEDVIRFISGVFEAGKPVGAVTFRETIADKVFRDDYKQKDPGYKYDMKILSYARNGFSWYKLKNRKDEYELTGIIDNNLNVRQLKDLFNGYYGSDLIQDFDSDGLSIFKVTVVTDQQTFLFVNTAPVECVMDRQGTISFSNAERRKIISELSACLEDWTLLCNSFNKAFTQYTGSSRENVETLRKHIDTVWDIRYLANTIDVNGTDFQRFLVMEDLLVLENAANANVTIDVDKIKSNINFTIFGKVTNPNVSDYVKMDYMEKKREAAKKSMSRLRESHYFTAPDMEETFEKVMARIDEKDREFQRNIAYVRENLGYWIAEKREGERVASVIRMADIDYERTYPASGEVIHPFLDNSHLENKGKITLINGDYLEYIEYVDSDNKTEYYKVENSYPSFDVYGKEFRDYNVMAQEFINLSKKKRL